MELYSRLSFFHLFLLSFCLHFSPQVAVWGSWSVDWWSGGPGWFYPHQRVACLARVRLRGMEKQLFPQWLHWDGIWIWPPQSLHVYEGTGGQFTTLPEISVVHQWDSRRDGLTMVEDTNPEKREGWLERKGGSNVEMRAAQPDSCHCNWSDLGRRIYLVRITKEMYGSIQTLMNIHIWALTISD